MKLRASVVSSLITGLIAGMVISEPELWSSLTSVPINVLTNGWMFATIIWQRLATEDLRLSSAGTWQILIPLVAFIVLLLRCVWWPVLMWWQQRRGQKASLTGFNTRIAIWSWVFSGMMSFLAIVSPMLIFVWMITGPWALLPEAASVTWLLMPLLVAGVCSPLMIALAVVAWHRRFWTLARRLHFTLITLILAVVIPWLHYWNLPGFPEWR